MKWFLLAPGPSMTAELAEQVRGQQVCAVGNAYELAPWANLLVHTDKGWWRRHQPALQFQGRKFCSMWTEWGMEIVHPSTWDTASGSGVLALDLLRNIGATTVVLLGFDMHGSHFFGPYTNGCANTPPRRRLEHLKQFEQWAASNRGVRVVNCTKGSKITAFEFANLEDHVGGEQTGGSRSDHAQAETAA